MMASKQVINGNYKLRPLESGSHETNLSLKVLIVGSGIGGLAAAIALRQQGHDVELFEQSRFADEIGAAIHVTPNANGALQSLGIDVKDHGANLIREIQQITFDGHLLYSLDNVKTAARWQHSWRMAHRGQLHSSLKTVALSESGKGKPVCLNTSSKVMGVDPAAGVITLANGTQVHGDVIVGADGVHSNARKAIPGNTEPFMSDESAFRFLIPRNAATGDPLTHERASKLGVMTMWYSEDTGRKAVLYSCSNEKLLNFVMIHPSELTSASGDYNQTGSKEKMLEIYHDFDPVLVQFLRMADPTTLKLYPLFDMKNLPTWRNQKLVLIGDAAHPFKPHLAQGGAQAIEDAISLGIMLSQITSLDEVSERLDLYEQARYSRGTTIQQYTREAGEDKTNLYQYLDYGMSHDEFHASTQLLRERQWSKRSQTYWRQPIAFGPMPGPRQDFQGQSRTANLPQATTMTASMTFKTSATLLCTLFPGKSYRFASLDTVAYASFRLQTLDNLEWLAGGGYSLVGLYIHGVEYLKKDGEVVSGDYLPVLFENAADPIISGREELGYPKVYSEIDIHREDTALHASFSWRGTTWGTLNFKGLKRVDLGPDASSAHQPGVLVHKYIPRTGSRGRENADADYTVYVPLDKENEIVPTKDKVRWIVSDPAHQASLDFLDTEPQKLPTLHHIIERLAEIPIYEVVEAKLVESMGVPDLSLALRVE